MIGMVSQIDFGQFYPGLAPGPVRQRWVKLESFTHGGTGAGPGAGAAGGSDFVYRVAHAN